MQVYSPITISLTKRLSGLTAGLVRGLKLLERTELACCGLPVSQSMVLQSLASGSEPKRMSEIAAALGVAQSTATRFVDPLVEQNLVERRPAPDDGRAIVIALTPAGRDIAEEVIAGSLRCSEGILERIPVKQQQQVVEALETVVAAVSECCTECCSR